MNLGKLFAAVVRWAYREGVVPGIDTRGIPSNECINCGSNMFKIVAGFDDYNISFWFTEAECANCGSPLTAPCPVDDPEYDPEDEDVYDWSEDDDD